MVSYFRYILICLISVMLLTTNAFGQIEHVDTLRHRVMQQLIVFPQEKIYVQTDKPYYIGGEDIWFRIHIVNAFLHQPSSFSRYVYCELINPENILVNRIKIKPDSIGYFYGSFKLSEELSEGDYQLRFYTRFMENTSYDYFFRKKIRIGDPLSAFYSTNATFNKDEKKQQLDVQLKCSDNRTGLLIWPENIKINYDLQDLEVKPDKDSIVRFSLKQQDCNYFHVKFDYEKKFHKQFIPIVSETSDFDVTFHPEGGELMLGAPCRIAFKALNNNGYGENITGIIVNEAGDTLSHFSSQHNGMGAFLIHSNGEKYFAECQNSKDIKKRFELPMPKSNSLALQTYWAKDDLWVNVIKPTGFQPLDSIYLFVQSRGEFKYLIPVDFNEPIQIPRQDLPSGIIQLILADKNFMPYSERLVFNYKEEDIASSFFSTSRNSYSTRDFVKTSIRLTDHNDNPVVGDFSLSVTDDNVVIPDTSLNICHYLLLSSDIRGFVENPAYYLQHGREQQANLDILMMTQGWRRYDFMKVLRGEPDKPSIPEEKSFHITGSVKGGVLMTQANAGYPVTLVSLPDFFFESTVTDENGRFKFEGFEMPDSTQITIQGQTKKRGKNVELIVDKEVFPAIKDLPAGKEEIIQKLFEYYIEKADMHFVAENGMRMIYLPEVKVVANRIEYKSKSTIASSVVSTVLKSEDFMQYNPNTVFEIIRNLPGVMVSGETVVIRGGETPLFMLDDVRIDPELVGLIDARDIDEIVITKGPSLAILGTGAADGVISIVTKKGVGFSSENNQLNIKTITPFGYQITKEFYSPKYETEEQKKSQKSDWRTTIHWEPCVVTNENGEAEVSFYSADTKTTYSVVYEGVTSDGLPVYGRGKVGIGL